MEALGDALLPRGRVAAAFILYKIKALMWSDLINELGYN